MGVRAVGKRQEHLEVGVLEERIRWGRLQVRQVGDQGGVLRTELWVGRLPLDELEGFLGVWGPSRDDLRVRIEVGGVGTFGMSRGRGKRGRPDAEFDAVLLGEEGGPPAVED